MSSFSVDAKYALKLNETISKIFKQCYERANVTHIGLTAQYSNFVLKRWMKVTRNTWMTCRILISFCYLFHSLFSTKLEICFVASQITLIIMFENVVIVTCVKYEYIYRKRRNEKATTTEIKIVHTWHVTKEALF